LGAFMEMTTTKEVTVIFGKEEFYNMVFDYVQFKYGLEIDGGVPAEKIELRVLTGHGKVPAKPTGLRIRWRQEE
jgi:hypothetical protein